MNRIEKLHALGQSIWYDNIQRRLLENGELAGMISRGEIRGITSNPSIFQNAIAKTHDYDTALTPMAWAGYTPEQIFYQLAVEDIQAAADLFLPLYEQTHGMDGYVSLEVSPYLAHDTQGTASEALALWKRVNRPNLMIKIPATKAGLPAITATLAAGVNVNVTLIFSLERYAEVMEAFLAGLEQRAAQGKPLDHLASVASFFVSRVDTKVDGRLQGMTNSHPEAGELQGKAAIANAKLAYELFKKTFRSPRFELLKAKGAQLQRPLWASTSTKNPAYRDVIYMEELIGNHTVNTVPPLTLDAFRDHGESQLTLSEGLKEAQAQIAAIEALGISMVEVTQQLEEEGVKAFADAFTALLKTVDERRAESVRGLGRFADPTAKRLRQWEMDGLLKRLWDHDPRLWTEDPVGQEEVRKRLGWLDLPLTSRAGVKEWTAFAQDCKAAGITHVVLLGMGGSSLAPEVLTTIFPDLGGLKLRILDSTDPAQVRAVARWSRLEETVYVVSSKSGSTSEVQAYLDKFWAHAKRRLGDQASKHFVAITDPDTIIGKLANERGFRQVFLSDPTVGGRYSALTPFGLVPAALLGIDPGRLLDSAAAQRSQNTANLPAGRCPAVALGALMGEAALAGVDKLTLLADPEWGEFGAWLEQLVAESTGKLGKGIVPIDGEKPPQLAIYSSDRLFVYLQGSGQFASRAQSLIRAGHPVVTLPLNDPYALGGEFYRWEFAVAVACAVLGVNGFDQPDVQDNKTRTANKVNAFRQTGQLVEDAPIWENEEVRVYGEPGKGVEKATSVSDVLRLFLGQVKAGDYVAINAYLPRNPRMRSRLQSLRAKIGSFTGTATTLGFGPRFLHSTGQLHKGGGDNGVFVQITADSTHDMDIPNEGVTFGTMERAQALGDLEALRARGKRAIRIHLKKDGLDNLL